VGKWQEALRRPLNGYALIVMILVSFTLAGAGMGVALGANKRSDLKSCAVVGGQVAQAAERVQAYEAAPPSTPAGLAQQYQAQQDLQNWADLERALGCPLNNREQ
jgi:hypothetical protein